LESSNNHKDCFKSGYWVGLIVNAIVFYWILYYKFDSYLLNIFLNALHFALFAYLYSLLKVFSINIRILIFPFLWTFLEYIREFGDLSLNWLNIGYTQGDNLILIQFADILGLNGIVFWICIINLFIHTTIFKVFYIKSRFLNFAIIILLFMLPYSYGMYKLNINLHLDSLSVTYVQPVIDSHFKWEKDQAEKNIDILINISKNLDSTFTDIVIWPETAIPATLKSSQNQFHKIEKFVFENKIHLITGVLIEESENEYAQKYNSVILLNPSDSLLQYYHKIKTVPIEESLPYSEIYDFLLSKGFKQNYYKEGEEIRVFQINSEIEKNDESNMYYKTPLIKFAAVICFESSFPSFIRNFIRQGSDFLIVVTNDEWFGYSIQPSHHLITSRLRAIENRKSVIHCSNAGISSFIDYNGNFYGTSKLLQAEVATQFVPLNDTKTIFNKFGDLIGKLSTVFILLIFILIFLKNRMGVK
jgi:apolipoprotein N-acyltransferase